MARSDRSEVTDGGALARLYKPGPSAGPDPFRTGLSFVLQAAERFRGALRPGRFYGNTFSGLGQARQDGSATLQLPTTPPPPIVSSECRGETGVAKAAEFNPSATSLTSTHVAPSASPLQVCGSDTLWLPWFEAATTVWDR